MDVHQVNSRAIHDDLELDDNAAYDAAQGTGEGVNHNTAGGVDNNGNTDGNEKSEHGVQEAPQQAQGHDLEKRATRASTAASFEETFPEGGFKAWLVVFGGWFALISSMGLMNTIGVFQAYTLSHQLKDHSEGTVGWIFSIYTFLAFFCGVYIGPIFDKYGPRWLVIAGCTSTTVGVVCMSFSTRECAS